MAQSDRGKIELFYDFFGEDNIANTATTRALGPFSVGGQGSEATDAGVTTLASDGNIGINGIGRISTTDETEHTTVVGTNIAFDVGLMGPLVAETRIQFDDLDTKEGFFGFADLDLNTVSLETDLTTASGTTFAYQASDICGFYWSSELTDDEDWHTIYAGGTASSGTDSTALDLDTELVFGEWQVRRLEIDTNGTARWYIDGVLKQTVVGAVSTSVDLAVLLGVETKGDAIETMDVDYLLLQANRDWTV